MQGDWKLLFYKKISLFHSTFQEFIDRLVMSTISNEIVVLSQMRINTFKVCICSYVVGIYA